MRKLTLALTVGTLLAATGYFAAPARAVASCSAKAVVVVGQTQGNTAGYINQANNSIVPALLSHGACVTTVYSPNAPWSAVKAAAKGANILIYLGHGSGYPNPYVSYLQPTKDDGMGLNDRMGTTSTSTYYYGESYVATLELAPNALVILNHLCYASGDNEMGRGNPSESTAKTRVEGYASGFLRGGAGAVLAEGLYDITYYIDALFTTSQTIDSMWRSAPSFNDSVKTWASSRNPTATAEIDPSYSHPASDGDVYYRSLVTQPGVTTSQALSGQAPTFTAGASGSWQPINPVVRLVDTRMAHVGPSGPLVAGGVVNYRITGGVVPTGAVAITANVTITRQKGSGTFYIAPTIDSSVPLPASTINFPAKDNRANGITVGLSDQGTVAVMFSGSGGTVTDFIIDVTGYYMPGTAGAGYNAFGPVRFVDSRKAFGISGILVAQRPQTFAVTGQHGLPATGITAVVGNITVYKPSAVAYIYIGPDRVNIPTSSTINFPKGDIRANNFIVPLAPDGTLSIVMAGLPAGSATAHVIVDISGYFTSSGGYLFHPVAPSRLLDTRANDPLPGPVHAMSPQHLPVTGRGGVASGAVALVGNLTATSLTDRGYLTVAPTIDPVTFWASNLNLPVRDIRANGFTSPLTTGGSLDLIYGGTTTNNTCHMIVDAYGYYLGDA
jgi:hypothetical protein